MATTIPAVNNFDINKIPTEGSPTFRADASYVWSTIPTVLTEFNAAIDAINIVGTEIETKATEALDSATASASSATASANSATAADASATIALNASNYKGDWVADYVNTEDGGNGYSQGMSVTLISDGNKYVSKVSANLVEPTSETNTAEWDFLEAVSPAELALKENITDNDTKLLLKEDIVDNDTKLALKQPVIGSSYTQIADASLATGTHTFDYALGDMQQLTATGAITIAFSNMVVGKVCSMIIDATDWGTYTITLPVGMLFDGATAPTFTASGTDRLVVIKDKDDVYSMFIVGQGVA